MNFQQLLSEIKIQTTLSSGPGGQHVNKTETKVRLTLNIAESQGFTETEKEKLMNRLRKRLTQDGSLKISAEESRSQLRNKEIALQKLEKVLTAALVEKKKRKKTKPGKAAVQKRIDAKKQQSEKKSRRKKIE